MYFPIARSEGRPSGDIVVFVPSVFITKTCDQQWITRKLLKQTRKTNHITLEGRLTSHQHTKDNKSRWVGKIQERKSIQIGREGEETLQILER